MLIIAGLVLQELFHHAHPVHFLNSRSKGIGVNTNNFDGTGGKGQFSPDGADAPNLFVRLHGEDRAVRALLHHAKEVSHWVSAEVVSCSSAKVNKDCHVPYAQDHQVKPITIK